MSINLQHTIGYDLDATPGGKGYSRSFSDAVHPFTNLAATTEIAIDPWYSTENSRASSPTPSCSSTTSSSFSQLTSSSATFPLRSNNINYLMPPTIILRRRLDRANSEGFLGNTSTAHALQKRHSSYIENSGICLDGPFSGTAPAPSSLASPLFSTFNVSRNTTENHMRNNIHPQRNKDYTNNNNNINTRGLHRNNSMPCRNSFNHSRQQHHFATSPTASSSSYSSTSSTRSINKTNPNNTNNGGGGCSGNSSLYKTEFCTKFRETGSCPFGEKCQFVHLDHELQKRSRALTYKTRHCWSGSECAYQRNHGRCIYLHGDETADMFDKQRGVSFVRVQKILASRQAKQQQQQINQQQPQQAQSQHQQQQQKHQSQPSLSQPLPHQQQHRRNQSSSMIMPIPAADMAVGFPRPQSAEPSRSDQRAFDNTRRVQNAVTATTTTMSFEELYQSRTLLELPWHQDSNKNSSERPSSVHSASLSSVFPSSQNSVDTPSVMITWSPPLSSSLSTAAAPVQGFPFPSISHVWPAEDSETGSTPTAITSISKSCGSLKISVATTVLVPSISIPDLFSPAGAMPKIEIPFTSQDKIHEWKDPCFGEDDCDADVNKASIVDVYNYSYESQSGPLDKYEPIPRLKPSASDPSKNKPAAIVLPEYRAFQDQDAHTHARADNSGLLTGIMSMSTAEGDAVAPVVSSINVLSSVFQEKKVGYVGSKGSNTGISKNNSKKSASTPKLMIRNPFSFSLSWSLNKSPTRSTKTPSSPIGPYRLW